MKYSTVVDRLQKLTNTTPSVGDLAKPIDITFMVDKNKLRKYT